MTMIQNIVSKNRIAIIAPARYPLRISKCKQGCKKYKTKLILF